MYVFFNKHFKKLFRDLYQSVILNGLTVKGRIPEIGTGYQCRKTWNTRSTNSTYPNSLLSCCHG